MNTAEHPHVRAAAKGARGKEMGRASREAGKEADGCALISMWEDRTGPEAAQATKWLRSMTTALGALDEAIGEVVSGSQTQWIGRWWGMRLQVGETALRRC